MKKLVILGILGTTIAGCNTTQTAESVLNGMEQNSLSPIELEGFSNSLTQKITALGDVEPMTQSELPVSGIAEYQGVMVSEGVGLGYLAGQLQVAVDFSAPQGTSVAGRVYNIYYADDTVMGGELTMGNGSFGTQTNSVGEDYYGFSTDLKGTLTAEDETYVVDGSTKGGFVGNAEILGLSGSGSVTTSSGSTSFEVIGIAEKQ